MDCIHEWSVELAVTKEERHLFTRVQECLAKHLGQPIDGTLCEADWTYHDIIRRFQAFPREQDPEPWRRFDNLLLRWLQILPASHVSLYPDELSGCELRLSV